MTGRDGFAASVAVFVLVLLALAFTLPAQVPVQFGAGGTPNRVVGPARAVAELGAGGLVVVLVVLGGGRLVARIPLRWVNVPHRDHWSRPDRQVELRRRLAEDLSVVGALTMLLLAGTGVAVAAAAEAPEPRLPGWWWLALVGYLLALGGFLAHVLTVRYRPPDRPDER